MKNNLKFLIFSLFILGVLLMLFTNCNNNDNKNSGNISKDTTKQVSKENTNTVTDIDGNIYHTVVIGSQVWLIENLRVTHFRNGDPIPQVSDNKQWDYLATGAYCVYDNISSNSETYGKLYNWYAATDFRKIAPNGWHIPNYSDYTTLISFLGGEDIAGSKLKETGTLHWEFPNTNANNQSGFTALPGGARFGNGIFNEIRSFGYLWCSSIDSTSKDYKTGIYYCAFTLRMINTNQGVQRGGYLKEYGFSIRCVKD